MDVFNWGTEIVILPTEYVDRKTVSSWQMAGALRFEL